ncbi:MAG: hypothetical protein WC812_04750 [Candidatus Pacearchaeota archaeon]|jgi:hypothetical protein
MTTKVYPQKRLRQIENYLEENNLKLINGPHINYENTFVKDFYLPDYNLTLTEIMTNKNIVSLMIRGEFKDIKKLEKMSKILN